MATALAVTIWLRWTEPFSGTNPVVFAKTALTTTVVTTLVWLVVTYVTKAEPQDSADEVLPQRSPANYGMAAGCAPRPRGAADPRPGRATCFPGSWAAPWSIWHCLVWDMC